MNNFETKETLEKYLESEESQEYRDMTFAYSYFDLDGDDAKKALDGELFEIPYWIEAFCDGTINADSEKDKAQYVSGYWEKYEIGTIETINGEKYQYMDAIPLDEESEHQAEDGKYVYTYRGASYLRIWRRVE
jgi:hypothetical protein